MSPISLSTSSVSSLSSIGGIGSIGSVGGAQATATTKTSGLAATGNAVSKASFGEAINDALNNVSAAQGDASTLSREFQLENPNVSLEETMIALQKASLGFQAAVQVRNKLVTAYNDIMNMQV
jgi:flagellar hook-basal body complex protein FliE